MAQTKKSEESSEREIEGLYFDGRKDETIKLKIQGKRTNQTLIQEEHVVLVEEPDSCYIGFVTPKSGTAHNITSAIIEFLSHKNICLKKLSVAGCDGTNVNTGSKGGILALLERHMKRPLQRAICLLHSNELPLRHLVEKP